MKVGGMRASVLLETRIKRCVRTKHSLGRLLSSGRPGAVLVLDASMIFTNTCKAKIISRHDPNQPNLLSGLSLAVYWLIAMQCGGAFETLVKHCLR